VPATFYIASLPFQDTPPNGGYRATAAGQRSSRSAIDVPERERTERRLRAAEISLGRAHWDAQNNHSAVLWVAKGAQLWKPGNSNLSNLRAVITYVMIWPDARRLASMPHVSIQGEVAGGQGR
jgi:hypothetical protein